MERWGTVNVPQSLAITHWEGRTNLYPRAHIYTSIGTPVTTVDLVHVALGMYTGNWLPTVEGQFHVIILVYTDFNHTILEEDTQRAGWTFFINSVESDIDELLHSGIIADQVWDEILPGYHDIAHSAGLYQQVIRETVIGTANEIVSNPQHSLSALDQKILDTRNILYNEINSAESAIQSNVNFTRTSIMGPDGRDLTEVYDNERGTNNALLANDPRLSFLDAAISSRSTLTANEVWTYVTRTLTGSAQPLTNADVAKIWDYLTSNITVAGSIGKYILDMMDAPISSRSTVTVSQIATLLGPLATQAATQAGIASVINEVNANELKLNDALALLALIKPQTDKIVNDGAINTVIVNEINQNQAILELLQTLSMQIKAKTDLLTNDIAKQSTLLEVPINPLLATDGRLNLLYNLNRLDVPVSTRAESFPTDYAKENTLISVRNTLQNEINQNEVLIQDIPTNAEMNSKLIRLDQILQELSLIEGTGFSTTLHSLVALRAAIVAGGGGSQLTAQQVWQYIDRSLTEYPPAATPEMLVDTKNEIIGRLTDYTCEMSTTINQTTDTQEVLCWLNSMGQTVTGTTNAYIEISDGVTDIWYGFQPTPNNKGVFRITHHGVLAMINDPDKNYMIKITINLGGVDYTTSRAFYTVGP